MDWGAIGIRKETVGAAVATSVHLFSYHNEANAFFKIRNCKSKDFIRFYPKKYDYCMEESNKQV